MKHSWRVFVVTVVVAGASAWVAAWRAEAQAPANTPRGVRTILLVRHGVYEEADTTDERTGRALIAEGREQARITGRRLALLALKPDTVYTSNFTRARETGALIAREMKLPAVGVEDLCECTPVSEREDINKGENPEDMERCREALDRAFARFFRPSPDQNRTTLLVAHGNVIRYLVARAVGLDSLRWIRMRPRHASISEIQINASGRMGFAALGDVGHLPPRLRTYSWTDVGYPRKAGGAKK
jgi:serine/threonine-protein phosphatase PGAM5